MQQRSGFPGKSAVSRNSTYQRLISVLSCESRAAVRAFIDQV